MKNELKKVKKQKKKLNSALEIVIGAITSTAEEVLCDDEKTAPRVKQIKELTGAARELYSLISALPDGEGDAGETVRIVFEGEGEQWGK